MNVLGREAEAALDVRKSRFLACALRAASAEDAAAAIRRRREAHPDAAHHPWAWRVGPAAEQARASDDGEPSGTGGPPILQLLARRELTFTLVVVTRYFGGIKLGTGGLSRAVGDAAKAALEAAGARALRLMVRLKAEVPHAALSSLERYAAVRGIEVEAREFGAASVLTLRVPLEEEPAFRSFHLGLTAGRGSAAELGRDYA